MDVKNVSGPISVAGAYTFSTRLSGVTHSPRQAAATRAKFPASARVTCSRQRRRFLTPFDLMVYGFSPVVRPPRPRGTPGAARATAATSGLRRDRRLAGHRPAARPDPAGRLTTIVIRSTLRQRGFPFGSGTRTMWFAPGKGLVKLVFNHRDGSVSTVERLS